MLPVNRPLHPLRKAGVINAFPGQGRRFANGKAAAGKAVACPEEQIKQVVHPAVTNVFSDAPALFFAQTGMLPALRFVFQGGGVNVKGDARFLQCGYQAVEAGQAFLTPVQVQNYQLKRSTFGNKLLQHFLADKIGR